MNWTEILKIMQIPELEPVEIELDREKLAESCCGQAKLDYLIAIHENYQDKVQSEMDRVRQRIERGEGGPNTAKINRLFANAQQYQQEIKEMGEQLVGVIDGIPCDAFRRSLEEESNRTSVDEMAKTIKQILKDWKECEGE